MGKPIKTVHIDVQLLTKAFKYLQKPFVNILPVLNETFWNFISIVLKFEFQSQSSIWKYPENIHFAEIVEKVFKQIIKLKSLNIQSGYL